jgi:hypothetical protein
MNTRTQTTNTTAQGVAPRHADCCTNPPWAATLHKLVGAISPDFAIAPRRDGDGDGGAPPTAANPLSSEACSALQQCAQADDGAIMMAAWDERPSNDDDADDDDDDNVRGHFTGSTPYSDASSAWPSFGRTTSDRSLLASHGASVSSATYERTLVCGSGALLEVETAVALTRCDTATEEDLASRWRTALSPPATPLDSAEFRVTLFALRPCTPRHDAPAKVAAIVRLPPR